MQDNRTERIRQRAYALWEADGFPQGRDAEHWYRAEQEIDGGAPNGQARSIVDAAAPLPGEAPAPQKRTTLTLKSAPRPKRRG